MNLRTKIRLAAARAKKSVPGILKPAKPSPMDSCVAGGVGGMAPDRREGRECTSPRMPDVPIQPIISTALPCLTVPAGGLDIGEKAPVCEQLARQTAPEGSPPPRFQTFNESWVWRPGLGIRQIASLIWPLSCTLSTSYTNLVCMSCKMEKFCAGDLPRETFRALLLPSANRPHCTASGWRRRAFN